MFPRGLVCDRVCVLLQSDPRRERQRVCLGVLAKPETAAYVLQTPNDVILAFWQAVTSHTQRERETERMFRAHLIRLSLSTNESNAQYYTQVFKTTLDLIFSRAGKRLITRDRSVTVRVTGTLYSKGIRCVGCL